MNEKTAESSRAGRVLGRTEDRPVIRLLQAINLCFTRLYHRVTLLSPSRLPPTGPAILVCNHVSGLDPLLIQSACPRLITWMMAREYYEIKALNWIFRQIEAIPVERSGRDLAATRAAMRALEQGRVLGVFPEGRLSTSPELLPFQTGVALMAMKTGVEVYPACLDGTQRNKAMRPAFLYPNRAVLAFGPPVALPGASSDRQGLQESTDRIRDAVLALRRRYTQPWLQRAGLAPNPYLTPSGVKNG